MDKKYKDLIELKIRTMWEKGKITGTQVIELIQDLNKLLNAQIELNHKVNDFDRKLESLETGDTDNW